MKVDACPLVSIVIPTFNHARFLGRALQSVLDQTYINWEVIIVDNYSQDNTDDVVRCFTDPRITLLKIHNNGIIAASRNMGIRAAKGEWIAFLDSDDWWTANKLEMCIGGINNQVDLVYHALNIVRENASLFKRKRMKSKPLKKPVFVDLLINGNVIANSSVVVRKKLLDQIGCIDENPKMIGSEDYNTWLRISQKTDAIFYLPKYLGFYMVHDHGVSKKNMSFSYECAIAQFIGMLSEPQRGLVKSMHAYMGGRYHYINREYDKAENKLIYCLKSANIGIRLRAMYMLAVIALRRHF